jgi:hypothetical protein
MTYLNPKTQQEIRQRFEEDSCIQLHEFLLPEKHAIIKEWLQAKGRWQAVGPYQIQRFDCLLTKTGNDEASMGNQLEQLFSSVDFSELIARLTSLSVGASSTLIRRFTQGCYSLARDLDDQEKKAAKDELDVQLIFVDNSDAWAQEDDDAEVPEDSAPPTGGHTVWAIDGEEEPLLVVPPCDNMLTLVFRKAQDEAQTFVKHVSNAAPSARFDITMISRCTDE